MSNQQNNEKKKSSVFVPSSFFSVWFKKNVIENKTLFFFMMKIHAYQKNRQRFLICHKQCCVIYPLAVFIFFDFPVFLENNVTLRPKERERLFRRRQLPASVYLPLFLPLRHCFRRFPRPECLLP